MSEQIKALSRIADALEHQNKLLDDLAEAVAGIREVVRDCAIYPADEKQHPRIVVGGCVDVFNID